MDGEHRGHHPRAGRRQPRQQPPQQQGVGEVQQHVDDMVAGRGVPPQLVLQPEGRVEQRPVVRLVLDLRRREPDAPQAGPVPDQRRPGEDPVVPDEPGQERGEVGRDHQPPEHRGGHQALPRRFAPRSGEAGGGSGGRAPGPRLVLRRRGSRGRTCAVGLAPFLSFRSSHAEQRAVFCGRVHPPEARIEDPCSRWSRSSSRSWRRVYPRRLGSRIRDPFFGGRGAAAGRARCVFSSLWFDFAIRHGVVSSAVAFAPGGRGRGPMAGSARQPVVFFPAGTGRAAAGIPDAAARPRSSRERGRPPAGTFRPAVPGIAGAPPHEPSATAPGSAGVPPAGADRRSGPEARHMVKRAGRPPWSFPPLPRGQAPRKHVLAEAGAGIGAPPAASSSTAPAGPPGPTVDSAHDAGAAGSRPGGPGRPATAPMTGPAPPPPRPSASRPCPGSPPDRSPGRRPRRPCTRSLPGRRRSRTRQRRSRWRGR